MRVFISWSGERSQLLAKAIYEWLPLVLHYTNPWISAIDISAGQRWSQALASELEAADFGVICMTIDNLSSPWIMFEAGALSKSLQVGRVIPLLLDVEPSALRGPLMQFQAKKADKDGFMGVIKSLNDATVYPISSDRLNTLFASLWPELEGKIKAANAMASQQISEDAGIALVSLDSFDCCPRIVYCMQQGKAVIVNTFLLESSEAQRAIDFIAGNAFSLQGFQYRLGRHTFVFGPSSMKDMILDLSSDEHGFISEDEWEDSMQKVSPTTVSYKLSIRFLSAVCCLVVGILLAMSFVSLLALIPAQYHLSLKILVVSLYSLVVVLWLIPWFNGVIYRILLITRGSLRPR